MKKLFLYIIFIIGLFQFSLQFLKLLPINPLTQYYQPVTEQYGLSFMPQNWRLFAPEPPKMVHRFLYRCGYQENNEKVYSYWEDPVEPAIHNHHRNRVSGDQYLVRYYKDAIRVLNNTHSKIIEQYNCKNRECASRASHELQTTTQYKTMVRIIERLCFQKFGEEPPLVQFRAINITPVPFSKRNSPQAKRKVEVNTYPISKTKV